MQKFAVVFFNLSLLTSAIHAEDKFNPESTPGKLPKEIVPRSYLVHLEPHAETLTTDGYEQIDIEVLKPTDCIVLNAISTEISSAKLSGNNLEEELTPVLDETQQTVVFHPKERLASGKYKLTFKFQSKITEQPHGLFVQYYQAQGVPERLLATHMEPSDARRMFPCWDEPSFRATYTLTVQTEKENTVVSNMPVQAEQPVGKDHKVVTFDKTPLMASYLVVLVCGKLEWLEDEVAGVKLRIITAPGKKDLGQYALEATKKILPYYTDYFGTAYPLPKLDQIALPSSGFGGAMENWGGIVYNEDVLLYDPKTSSEATKQRVFSVMAHEIAHQWFGNLVTMAWWNNLWLNEGFASWMQTKATDHFNPDWRIWLRSNESKERAMALDSRKTTHPIQQPIADEEAAHSAFDEITYQKGQCFIRMLENYLGEDAFRDGIRAYIAANKYSNTTTANLWEALEETARKPVKKMASSWTEQPGFPLIKMTAQCISGKRVVSLEQVRFMLGEPDETPAQWSVPVGTFSTTAPNDVKYMLLEKLSNNFNFPSCDGAIKANADNMGFFRVLYEPDLFNDLQKNVLKLSEADRLNLVTDTWAMVESGNAPVSTYFDLLDHLQQDNSLAVWESTIGVNRTIGAIRLIDRLEQGQPGRKNYQKYICRLLGPKLAELGWDERAEDDNQTRLLRVMLIETLGFFGDKGVIDESFKRFALFQQDLSSLAPNLRPPVTHIVGRYSSEATYTQLSSMMENAEKTEDKRMYLRALTAVLDPDLAKKTLELTLSSKVPPADASRALESLATEGEHPHMAWDYATGHLDKMRKRFGFSRWNRLLPSIAEGFTDEAKAIELLNFVKSNLSLAAIKEAESSANLIVFHAKLKAKELPAIDKWITDKMATTSRE